MTENYAELRAQILSLRPGELRTKAGEMRDLGAASITAGTTLRTSAERLGGVRGAPYAAYRERVTPTASWLTDLNRPASDNGMSLDAAAAAAQRAQMVLAQVEESLARAAAAPGATPASVAVAERQAVGLLNQAIAEVTAAYGAVAPPAPSAAPVVAGGGGGAGRGAGAAGVGAGAPAGAGGTSTAAGGVAAVGDTGSGTGAAAAGVGAEGAVGPTSGPFAGFVQDPTTGNLVDPGTGRQVDASGRFLDPITGEPFGSASPFVSRLEGLDGGVSPVGGPPGTGAGVAGLAPVGAGGPGGAGLGTGGLGAGALVAGAVPLVAAGGLGLAAARGGRDGTGFFAGLYGGVVPPSLSARNPAAAQLRQQAAQNLDAMAGTAQRYAAIASGNAPAGYLPPIAGAGVGAGAAAGARSAGSGRSRGTTEPAGVWGAAGGGVAGGRRRTSAARSADVEDESIWSAGAATPRSLG